MHRPSILALGLGALLATCFLGSGCDDTKKSGIMAPDGGQGAGGAIWAGGGQGAGAISGMGGMLGMGGTLGIGGMLGMGGMSGMGGSTNPGGTNGTGGATGTLCTTFNACGGSVVGTWVAPGKRVCGPTAPTTTTLPTCPGYSATVDFQTSGTITFNAGGTYASATVAKGNESFIYPLSCLPGFTCDELVTQMSASADPGSTVSCQDNGAGACVCSASFSQTKNELGSYSTTGGKLTITPDDSSSAPETMDYCVQGNAMTMQTTDTSSGDTWQTTFPRQ